MRTFLEGIRKQDLQISGKGLSRGEILQQKHTECTCGKQEGQVAKVE